MNRGHTWAAIAWRCECCGAVSRNVEDDPRFCFVSRKREKAEHEMRADARAEHAWMLRLEGLSLDEIGKRMGGQTGETARRLIDIFSRQMRYALREAKFYVVPATDQ